MKPLPICILALLPGTAPDLHAQVETAPVDDRGPRITEAPIDRSETLARDVVLYQGGFGLVEERRRLPPGRRTHYLGNLPASIRADSLSVTGTGEDQVLTVRLRTAPVDGTTLLREQLGERVLLVPRPGVDAPERPATLIALADGVPIVHVDGYIEFGGPEAPWRVVLPAPAPPAATRPLTVALRDIGPSEIRLSYLADGLGWQADHTLALDGGRADLRSRASVRNDTDAALGGARLRLVAGDVASERPPRPMSASLMRAEADGGETSEAAIGGWRSYTIERPTDLRPGEVSRVPLLDASDLRIERRYRVTGRGDHTGAIEGPADTPVAVELKVELPDAAPALPAGVVRVMERTEDDRPRYLGADSIDHTPAGGDFTLTLGPAFDVSAERSRTRLRQLDDQRFETGWAIELRNDGSRAVEIDLVERLGGDWSLIDGDDGWHRRDSGALTRSVSVAPGETERIEYMVRVTR